PRARHAPGRRRDPLRLRGRDPRCSSLAERLRPRRAAEPRQLVADAYPRGAVVEEEMGGGRLVDRALHVREPPVDVVGMAGRLAEERAATGATEAPRAVVGRPVADELLLAAGDPEPRVRDAEPGDVARPVRPLAHRAVAVRAEERRQLDREADGA